MSITLDGTRTWEPALTVPRLSGQAPKGYRGIGIVVPTGEHSDKPFTNYHRPHRKAATQASRSGEPRDVGLDRHRYLLYTSLAAEKLAAAEAHPAPLKHVNPVAAAMDLPYLDAHSKQQVVRKPPKLPPMLQSQAEELKEIQRIAANIEKKQEEERKMKEKQLHLEFDRMVRAEMGQYQHSTGNVIFHEMPQTAFDRHLPPPSDELTVISHKTQWLNTVSSQKGAVGSSAMEQRKTVVKRHENERHGHDNSDEDLFIVRTAETDDADENGMKSVYSFDSDVSHLSKGDRNSSGRHPMSAQTSRPVTQRTSAARRSYYRQSTAKRPNPAGLGGTGSNESPTDDETQTLSRSTVRLLKKFTREGVDGAQAMALPSRNIESLLRVTLTGTTWDREQRTARYIPYAVVPKSPQPPPDGAAPDKAAVSATPSRKSHLPTQRHRRAYEFYNPVMFQRAMQALEEGKYVEAGQLAKAGTQAPVRADEIQLRLPSAHEARDDDDTSTVTDDPSNDGTAQHGTGGGGNGSGLTDPLAVDFNIKFLHSLSKKPATPQLELPEVAQRRKKDQAAESTMHFSLTRFVILLKRLAKERLKPKPISDGRTLNAADGDSSTSHSATSKHSFLDFLETPYISLDRPPMKNTPAFNALFKTLAQALCDTSPDRTLRFEAFRLLIQIDNEPQLGRWEVIAFRRVIDEMLQHGNASEQWLAATTLARQGELNDIVLSILRKSLGDVDAARRALALQMLGGLDVSLADRVLQIVLEDCGSTSWRVRCDAVTLLEVWVQKLSELLPCPTDDDDLQTTLHGGGSQSSERSSVASRSTRPSTQQHPPSESEDSANARQLLQMSVQMLLSLMWNDWHQDVRQVASSALARLGKGRTVLDWLVAMLGAEDPLRRVDALRACMRLGFLLAAAVDSYVMCLADNFASVRLEACKLACVVQMKDRSVLNSLLDRVTDFEWQVRAYAVKGVANSGNTDPQVHAALRCVLYHDPNPSVRAEAINATQSLGILAQDKVLQQAVFTLREVDPTPAVRKEADKALTAAVGLIIATGPGQDLPTFTLTNEAGAVVAPSATTNNANAAGGSAGLGSPMPTARGSGNSSVPTTSGRGAASNASNATLSIPFAHILSDRSPAEASVFLRTSLVEEKELEAVIDQVRDMAGQDRVTAEVMESNSGPHPYDEDEEVVDDHVPDVKAIHERKGRRHIDIGLPEIVRKLPGVPMKRPWQNRHRTVAGAAE